MCDCIEQMRNKIKEVDPKGSLVEVQAYANLKRKVGEPLEINERMCAHYSVRIKNKKGEFTTKNTRGLVEYDYCPFCGEKYV